MKKLLVIVEILNHVGGLTHSIRPAAVTHVECIFRELLTELHSPLADNDGCLCFSNRQMEVESNTWWKTRDDRFIQVLGNKTQSPFDCEEIKRRPSGVKLRMNSFLSITTTLRLWSMNRSFHRHGHWTYAGLNHWTTPPAVGSIQDRLPAVLLMFTLS